MAYTKQGFRDGMVLNAGHMTNMEDAIIELYDLVSKLQIVVQTEGSTLVLAQDLAITDTEVQS